MNVLMLLLIHKAALKLSNLLRHAEFKCKRSGSQETSMKAPGHLFLKKILHAASLDLGAKNTAGKTEEPNPGDDSPCVRRS